MNYSSALPTRRESGVVMFRCPEQTGFIGAVANFFTERELTISRYVEFTDNAQFVARFEWTLNDRWENEASFRDEFSALAQNLNAEYRVLFNNRIQTIGLFTSTHTHTLIEVLNKLEAGYFPNTEIGFIIGDSQAINDIADRHGVPFFLMEPDSTALEQEAKQLEIVQRYKPDLVCMACYSTILSANFLERIDCPVLNAHHSFLQYLPASDTFQIAHEHGVKLIGATAYFVTAQVGNGPIVDQDVARVKAGASVRDMVEIGRTIEKKVFVRAALSVLEHKVLLDKERTIVFE